MQNTEKKGGVSRTHGATPQAFLSFWLRPPSLSGFDDGPGAVCVPLRHTIAVTCVYLVTSCGGVCKGNPVRCQNDVNVPRTNSRLLLCSSPSLRPLAVSRLEPR